MLSPPSPGQAQTPLPHLCGLILLQSPPPVKRRWPSRHHFYESHNEKAHGLFRALFSALSAAYESPFQPSDAFLRRPPGYAILSLAPMYISTMKGAFHADHPQSRCRRSAAAYGHLSHGAGIYAQTGNPTQWGRSYPSPELIRSDIAQGICRVLSDEAGIHGVFALLDTPEPTYSRIEGAWRNDAPYLTIHRLAGDGRTTRSLPLCCGLLQGHFPECSSGYPRRQPHHAAFAGRERLPPLRHDPCAGRNAPAGIPLDGRPP